MLFEKVKTFLSLHKYLLLIIAVAFVLRIINLTLLPIFNDEAIYLDWGWRETHTHGFLFYSLYDAKQPLLMWVFGLAQSLFSDILVAGRSISILTGIISLIGLFVIGKAIWNKYVGLLAAFLYAVSPLFLFYDRQALMESAIAAVGIWSCYFLLKLATKPILSNALFLGVVLGIGYFIKSSSLIFILASLVVYAFFLFQEKRKIFPLIIATYLATFVIILPLLFQPVFWQSLPSNARFSLTLSDYLQFPIGIWANNIFVFLGTTVFFVTPLVILASVLGIRQAFQKTTKHTFLLLLWLCVTLSLQVLVTRNSSVRYLISFLPLLLLFASYFVFSLQQKFRIAAILIIVILPFIMSVWQTFSPAQYILSLSKVTPLAPIEYVVGPTSGYGISEIQQFIHTHAKTPTSVGIAENTGNPESAIEVYYEKNSPITPMYLDRQLLGPIVDQYDCLDTGSQLFFVSRGDQLAGLDKFFVKVHTITNPYGGNIWGIYTLKPDCKGKIAHLSITK